MGKVAGCIAVVWFVGCSLCGFAAGGDRNQRNHDDSIRKAVVDTLKAYLFVKEATGKNDGYWVERILKSVGAKKGDPWCGAFQGYVFKLNNLPIPKYAARAANWFDEKHTIPNRDAIQGDHAALYYQNLGRIGHIGMYLAPYVNKTPYVTLGEGNTNDKKSNEGNRTAKVFRPRATIYKSANWIDK